MGMSFCMSVCLSSWGFVLGAWRSGATAPHPVLYPRAGVFVWGLGGVVVRGCEVPPCRGGGVA